MTKGNRSARCIVVKCGKTFHDFAEVGADAEAQVIGPICKPHHEDFLAHPGSYTLTTTTGDRPALIRDTDL